MGRTVTTATLATSQRVDMPAGFLGIFGAGNFRPFYTSGTFVVPAGVSRLRVRVVGGGGGFSATYQSVPTGYTGGASSFGNLISATGGAPGTKTTPGAGGVGVGGDFQASGGAGGPIGGGGGAAGSQLGVGGAGGAGSLYNANGTITYQCGGGGGVGGGLGGSSYQYSGGLYGTSGGGSPYGSAVYNAAPDWLGNVNRSATAFSSTGVMRFPFDTFSGGGGVPGAAQPAGPGGGSPGMSGGSFSFVSGAGVGGGGGGSSGYWGFSGNIGGGAGGGFASAGSDYICGCGGGGYAHGVFNVTPGDSYTVTVAAVGNPMCGQSGGLVVVEW